MKRRLVEAKQKKCVQRNTDQLCKIFKPKRAHADDNDEVARMCPFQARLDLQDYRTETRQGHKKLGGSGDGQMHVVQPYSTASDWPGHSMQRPLPASALAVPISEQHKSKQSPILCITYLKCDFCLPGGQSVQPDEAGSSIYLPVLGKEMSKQNDLCN